jgi:hypothetical protein
MILQNDIYALFNTVALAILPYTGWLAASVVALLTLRKGISKGFLFLIAAVFIHFFMMSKTPLSTGEAFVSALLSYVPCYLAAATLYLSVSWHRVFQVLFLQVFVLLCFVQAVLPDFAMQQYLYIREILSNFQLGDAMHAFTKTASLSKQAVFAHYLMGTQAAGIVLSSFISLALARCIQSLLYYPEGFKQEMRSLRGTKSDCALLVITFLATKQKILLAIDVLPVFLLLFFITGFSLWFDCSAKRGFVGPMIVLSIVLLLFPYAVLPIYVMFGSLDTLFNFRLYLRHRADTKI